MRTGKSEKEIALAWRRNNAVDFAKLVRTDADARIALDFIFRSHGTKQTFHAFKYMIGYYDGDRHTAGQTANRFKMSEQRVNYAYSEYMEKLEHYAYREQVEDFLETNKALFDALE